MDIPEKKRRVYQKSYYLKYKFFAQQRRYFIEVHEKALEQQKKERENVNRFILCFD
jgi:hypothetical protein